jgi:hypothetical protein
MISHALIAALIMTESSNRDWVVNGDAVGCLQIRPCVVVDASLYSGRHYRMADRLDRAKSIEMLRVYLTHYCGNDADDHSLAMTWRFGPTGASSCNTAKNAPEALRYWKLVKGYRDHPELISHHEIRTSNTRGALRRFLTRLGCGYLCGPKPDTLADRRAGGYTPDTHSDSDA